MKLSNLLVDGKLISEFKWENYISSLEKSKLTSNKTKLKDSLINSIKQRIPRKRFGILFSGGVDSTTIALVCKRLKADFICYSVGLDGSSDLLWAKKAAKRLKLRLRPKKFSLSEAESMIKKTTKLLKKPDVVNVGVGSVVYAAAKLAKKDKITTLFSGLGSEEIFAGYHRHSKATDQHEECWLGLRNMYQRDFMRDYALANKLKITLLTPFLDKDLILSAMGINIKRKINTVHKKIILRQIAQDLGLPKKLAWREKKAAQYGSKFDRAILRLARKNKFKYKKDYLKTLL